MKALDIVTAVLMIIGGLNWGWVGFFGYNLVSAVLGEATAYSRVFYALVGLSALYECWWYAFDYKGLQHRWCETATAKH